MRKRLKQSFCLLLTAAMVASGLPAAFADSPDVQEESNIQPDFAYQTDETLSLHADNADLQGMTIREGVLVNESFDTIPAVGEHETRPMVNTSSWGGSSTALDTADGWLRYLSGAGNINNTQMNLPISNGYIPDTGISESEWGMPLTDGKYYVEFTLRKGDAGKGTMNIYFADYTADKEKDNIRNLMKVVIGKTMSFDIWKPGGTKLEKNAVTGVQGVETSAEGNKYCFLFDTTGTNVILEKIWLNDTQVSMDPIEMDGTGDGLCRIAFCPGEPKAYTEGTEILGLQNYSVSTSRQELLGARAEAANLTFDDIKGENTDASVVDKKLNFSKTATANGLSIRSWKTSDDQVISADGTVTLPKGQDTAVTLTPVLGMKDIEGVSEDGWLTVDGMPITVTVKAEASEPTEPDPEDPAVPEGALVYEPFDTMPTAAEYATRPMVSYSSWSGGDASLEVQDGWLRYLAKAGKINQHQVDWPLYNGFIQGTKDVPEDQYGTPLANGKYYVEFTLRGGDAGKGTMNIYFSDYNNSMKDGGSLNLIKMIIGGSSLSFEATTPTSTDIKAQKVSGTSDVSLSGDGCRFRFLFDVSEERVALEQVWLNGAQEVLSQAIELNASGKGLNKLMFCPGEGKEYPAGTEILAMDNYTILPSQLTVLEQKIKEDGAKLSFDDIKGANTSIFAVESDLDFSKTETTNGLKILGWKTSNADVITTEGKVTRPQENDVKVVLTPILGMADTMDEVEGDWLTSDGTPISVTVKSVEGGEVEINAGFTYIQNETFDKPLTDPNTQPIPRNENWGAGTAAINYDGGDMNVVHSSGNKLDYQIHLPFRPGKAVGAGSPSAAPVKEDNLYMDIKWTIPEEAASVSNRFTIFICGAGSTTKVFRCNFYTDGTFETGSDGNLDQKFQGGKIGEENRLTLNFKYENGVTTVENLWLNDQKMDFKKKTIADIGNGFNRVIFFPYPNEEVIPQAGTTIFKVNEVKVWRAFEAQLTDISNKPEEEIPFEEIANGNTDANNVTTNLNLTTKLISPGSTFTVNGWKSSDETIIAADGTVTRPSYEDGDQQVTLSPVIEAADPEKVGGNDRVETVGKPITVTVKAMTVDEQLDYLANNLSFQDICGDNESADAVEHDLNLINKLSGVDFAWELVSVEPAGTNASLDLKTGVLQRPLREEGDAVMTVRANLSVGDKTAVSKPISFTVKKLEVSVEQYLKEVSDMLTFALIGGDNKNENAIKMPLNLPEVLNGARISWSSDNAAIGTDGSVTRPPFGEKDAKVNLTAKVSYGAASIQKTFALIVLAGADNLVKDSVISASSGVDVTAEEWKAIYDENLETAVTIKSSLKKFSLTFDLGETKAVSNVEITEKENGSGVPALQTYTVDVSDNNNNWETVYTGTISDFITSCDFDPIRTRYIRLNVTGKKAGTECALAEIAVRYQPSDSARVKADAEALTLDLPQRITADSISLPETGIFGSEITWSFTPDGLISDDYEVTHGKSDRNVTLIAEIKSGSETEQKRFQRTISGTQNGSGSSGSGGSGGGGNRGNGGGTIPSLPSQPTTEPTTPPTKPTEIFNDLGEAPWAKTAVLDLYEKGIVNGKEAGKFYPLDEITREEYVKMLMLAFGFETAPADGFTDVDPSEWYALYIGGAVQAGIVNGIGEGLFGIGQNITRQDMAVMTLRAAQAAKRDFAASQEQAQFKDQEQIAEYALDAVAVLQASGVLNGDENGYFNPQGNANRAAAAKTLYTLLTVTDENGGDQ